MKPPSISALAILATALNHLAAAAAVLPADAGTPTELIDRDSLVNTTADLNIPGLPILKPIQDDLRPLTDLKIPGVPPFVDTIVTTLGIPSTLEVKAARLIRFCPRSDTNKDLCTRIQNRVYSCVDQQNDCPDDWTRNLLKKVVDLQPCLTFNSTNSVAYQVCIRLYAESKRCIEQTKRGPCAVSHVNYMLRHFRDFLDLKKGLSSQMVTME